MLRILYISFLAVLCSCQNNNGAPEPAKEDTATVTAPGADSSAENISGCFLRDLNRDTLVAHLQQTGDSISGKLSYDNFEKDGSSGSVHGHIDSGIIKLLYAFRSEGMNSVMEVYFKVQGDALLQGIGERTNRGDTVFFADPSAVTFQKRSPLKKIDCSQLEEKFR